LLVAQGKQFLRKGKVKRDTSLRTKMPGSGQDLSTPPADYGLKTIFSGAKMRA
jgi:hypothetical protein